MRFFHLSDLHIGRRLNEHNLREDQEYILGKIVDSAREQKPDAVVIAGDVFDKSDPAAEAVSLFSRFVTDLVSAVPGMPVMVISGNHDSADRIDLYREILNKQNVFVAGVLPQTEEERLAKITLEDEMGPVHFYLLPFVRPQSVRHLFGEDEEALSYEKSIQKLLDREEIDPGARNVLVTHQFFIPSGKTVDEMAKERTDSEMPKVGNVDAVSAAILSPFTYCALGHVHKPMNIGKNARYCGTPLQYSLSERGQEKSITVVELGAPDEEASLSFLPLEPLRRVRHIKGDFKDVVREDQDGNPDDYVYITLTDREDLDMAEVQRQLAERFRHRLGYEHTRNLSSKDASEFSLRAHEIRRRSPLELCLSFLKDEISDQERRILEDTISELEDKV